MEDEVVLHWPGSPRLDGPATCKSFPGLDASPASVPVDLSPKLARAGAGSDRHRGCGAQGQDFLKLANNVGQPGSGATANV